MKRKKLILVIAWTLCLGSVCLGEPLIFNKLQNTLARLTCRCECKYTKVQKCKNEVKQNCHTEYEKRCETYQGKETCVQIPRKDCHTQYRQECKKEKSCHEEHTTKCVKIPYQTCHDVPKCHTTYKEDCKPSYQYGKTCKQIPQEHCSYEKKCDTKYQEKCRPVPHEVCDYQDNCKSIPYEKCKLLYDKKCKKEPVQVCNPFPKKKCKKEIKRVPYVEKPEECQRCYQTQEEYVETVPKQRCHKEPKQSCETNYEKSCKRIPRKDCSTIYKEKCNNIPKQECKQVYEEKCVDDPYSDCQTRYEKKCRYDTQCRVGRQLKCKKPSYSTPKPTYDRQYKAGSKQIVSQLPRLTYPAVPARDYKEGFQPSSQEFLSREHVQSDPKDLLQQQPLKGEVKSLPKPSGIYYKPLIDADHQPVRRLDSSAAHQGEEEHKSGDADEPAEKSKDAAEDEYDPKLDSLGFLRKIGDSQFEETLHYGLIAKYCKYEPQEECRQTEVCDDIPHTDCKTRYKKKCSKVPREKCKTAYDKQCYKIPQEKCRTKYDTQCQNIPYEKCKTNYEKKCRVDYEEVVRYKTKNNCYWPKSKYKDEPCH